MAQIDPDDVQEKTFDHSLGALDLVSDSNREALLSRDKALDAELRTFALGFAVVVAMAAVAAWWVWCAHDAELVDAKAKVDQMERRLMEADLNARDLRTMYQMKMRGRK